jgi:predicted permease
MRVRFWLPLRLRSLFAARTLDRDMDDELREHLERLAELYVQHGATPAEAMQQARRDFGGLDQLKEECRDMRRVRPLEDLGRDLRVGFRLLARSPVFSLVAILSLAIGIGANTAIFTLINALVLRELPVPEPGQLFNAAVVPSEVGERFSYPAFSQARDQLAGRAELCAMSTIVRMQLVPRAASQTPEAESGWVQLVSGEWFDVLRQRPQLGRLLTPDDNRHLGAHPVAVISDGYWSRRYGRSPAALGTEVTVNNVAFTIVGVTAPTFFGLNVATRTPDVWVPLMMQPAVRYASNASISNTDGRKPWPPEPGVRWLNVFARVPDGATLLPLADTLTRVLQQEEVTVSGQPSDAEDQKARNAMHVVLAPGSRGISNTRESLQQPLVVLQFMVGFLLLIACANIASLLLARSTTRLREMAIRLSIGAGRGRLVRQLLAESLLLSLVGGGLGLLLAHWGSRTLFTLARGTTDFDLSIDRRVLGYTLGISMLTGVLFGLAPALRATRVSPSETLKTQGRLTIGEPGGGRLFSFGKLLLATQMALCLLLLIVAGLFARSLQALAQLDLGFDRDHLLIARLDPRAAGYASQDLNALYRRLLDRVSTTPGVASASMSLHGVLSGGVHSGSFSAEGYTPRPGERMNALQEDVTADYFRTHGIRLVKGRPFERRDEEGTRRVSIINETMARRYFGGRDPIGLHWGYGDAIKADAPEIIGVARDVHSVDLRSDVRPLAYSLVVQGTPKDTSETSVPYLSSLEVRTVGPPAALADTLRRVLRDTAPRLPVPDITPMTQFVERMSRQEQLIAYLTTLFSGIALLLASLGLYGSISYAVTRRTSEIGVRMALGANRAAVLWLILRDALTLVLMGLAIGVPLALLAANGIRSMLFGIRFTDAVTHTTAVAVLALVAAIAAYLPARRAARVDPMAALRAD